MHEKDTFRNFLWHFMERWFAQGVTFIVSIVLARILGPDIYGTLALVMAFITILQVFIDGGLGTALVQKENADDLDFSSVFWFNVAICFALYLFTFAVSPIISSIYGRLELTSIIRALSLIIIISGIKNIQQAYVARNMLFKKFFFATLWGTVIAAIIGIYMACNGYGVWSIVAQYLVNAAVDTLVLWMTVGWRPKLLFSFSRFKGLFSYGWKILVSGIIDTTYNQLRALLIGKFYSNNELAFYSKGEQLSNYAVQNINVSMNSVLLTVLARKQKDIIELKKESRRIIRLSSYIIWPMMIGLAVVADNLILVILGEEWLPAAMFLRVLCLAQVLQPLQTTNLSVIKAVGRSDFHLILEIVKKTIAIIIVFITVSYGTLVIAIGAVAYAVIATIINSYPNRRLINYKYEEQIKDIMPFIGMSIAMGGCVWAIGLLPIPILLLLVIQVITGIVIYIFLSKIFRVDEYEYLLRMIKQINQKKGGIYGD